jgi:hypothetical protein
MGPSNKTRALTLEKQEFTVGYLYAAYDEIGMRRDKTFNFSAFIFFSLNSTIMEKT